MVNPKQFVYYATRFQQHDISFFQFKVPHDQLLKWAKVIPHADNRDYPQRILNKARCEDIARYVSKGKALPPAIIVTFYKGIEVHKVSNLAEEFDLWTIRVPNDGYVYAYCLDGQHRVWAFDKEVVHQNLTLGDNPFDLPIIAFPSEVPLPVWREYFIDINVKQEKVKPTDITTLQGDFKLWPASDPKNIAFEVAQWLNTVEGGPLFQRIRFSPKDKGTHFSNTVFISWLKDYVGTNSILESKSVNEIAEIINNYFEAWHQVFATAWNERPKHVLLKTAGIRTMFALFKPVYQRVRLEYWGVSNVQNFLSVIQPLRDADIQIEPPGAAPGAQPNKVKMDWSSEKYAPYCSGEPNIQKFVRALQAAFDRLGPGEAT